MAVEDPGWPRAATWLAGGGSSDPAAPLLAVLGVPLSQASISPSGAHETPAAVRRVLRRYATFAAIDGGGVELEQVAVRDLGDLELAGLPNVEAQDQIAQALAGLGSRPELPRPPDLVVLLGGDNAITRPACRGLLPELAEVGLLTLDAHHDVRGFHDGPTNGTPVRGLVDEGLPGGNVVQIGIGTFTNSAAYRRYADEAGIATVTVAEARAEGVGACVRRHLDALSRRCRAVYVDLDVDVLDVAFAPGCPGARPGGLTPTELHGAALEAGRHRAVRAIDIVEVDATADPGGQTVDNAALCLLHAAAGLTLRGGGPETGGRVRG
jgi:formiminoglutamase